MLFSRLKTANITVTTNDLHISQVTAGDTDVKVAKRIRLEPRSVTPVTFVSTTRILLRLEQSMALVQRQMLQAKEIMEVMPIVAFRIVLTKISTQHVHVPKHMFVRQLCNNLKKIVDPN